MADSDLDGGQANGTAGSPNSAGSQGAGDSNSSFDAAKLQTAFEALTKRLDEVDQRSKALQGDKDRAVNKTKSEVDELKRKFAEVEKLRKTGLDEDSAFEELSFRDEIRNVREQLSKLNPAQPNPAGNGNGSAVDVAKVIEQYGLDGNDPEVVDKVLRGSLTAEQADIAALRLAYQRAKPSTSSPSAASAPSGKPAVAENQDAKIARLSQLQKEPTKHRAEIKKLEGELGW